MLQGRRSHPRRVTAGREPGDPAELDRGGSSSPSPESTAESAEVKRLKRENAELRRANEILKLIGFRAAQSNMDSVEAVEFGVPALQLGSPRRQHFLEVGRPAVEPR